MLNILSTLCCIIYYVTAAIMEVPAIIRVLKRKKSEDYSVTAILLYLISTISWSIYIYTSEQNVVVYVGTFVDLVICIIYTVVMLRYHESDEV